MRLDDDEDDAAPFAAAFYLFLFRYEYDDANITWMKEGK
jgi:hypothetical protein